MMTEHSKPRNKQAQDLTSIVSTMSVVTKEQTGHGYYDRLERIDTNDRNEHFPNGPKFFSHRANVYERN